jgi:glycerol uptake facilitator-like aquaporin
MLKSFIAETHGSAMMSFLVLLSGNLTAITAGLWLCVLASGGAFFNPCITLAFLFKKANKEKVPRKDIIKDLLCIVFQLIGATIGSIIAWQVSGKTLAVDIGVEKTSSQAFFMEVLGSFQLILTLMIIVDLKDPLHVGIFSVIITVYLVLSLSGPISGGCLNPTLCTGINIGNAMITGTKEPLHVVWIYIIAPLIGTMVAVAMSQYLMIHQHHSIIPPENSNH